LEKTLYSTFKEQRTFDPEDGGSMLLFTYRDKVSHYTITSSLIPYVLKDSISRQIDRRCIINRGRTEGEKREESGE
jgi:hypothetical protein